MDRALVRHNQSTRNDTDAVRDRHVARQRQRHNAWDDRERYMERYGNRRQLHRQCNNMERQTKRSYCRSRLLNANRQRVRVDGTNEVSGRAW
ncbi:hypothetical protein MBAV_000357 [Candidatus Magnetobacterium bavaricum]|uniref:Uncharacterized protein n=1 Tax=Candidatus Magnetobacterium bavaricum TaxID=29290 RepID=A0A0F3GZZ4_9BACT|nr:hypothetical protein MBAV_000357 [Candidatus Magnetobacterium bavaricum]